MNKYSFAALAISLGLFSATQANASTLDTFDLTGDGNTFTFSLSSPSTPMTCHSFGDVCYTDVTVDANGHNQTDTIEFTNSDGIDIFNSYGQSIVDLTLNNHQPDFFTNNKGSVVFLGGTFYLSGDDNGWGNDDYNNYFNCGNGSNYTLVIDPPSAPAVPEPSSLVLMSSGLLAAAGAVRRRMKK